MPRSHLRPDLARNHRLDGRCSGPSSACRWRRASLSPPWFCNRPMAAGASRSSPRRRRSSFQRHHCRRKIRRCPHSPLHLAFKWPRRRQHHRKQHHREQHSGSDPTQDAARTATATLPDHTQLLQTMARNLANHGAKHRTAQGEPATNSQRQFKSDRGTQGEPGRDKTRAREGFGADPAQDITASDAANFDRAQATDSDRAQA